MRSLLKAAYARLRCTQECFLAPWKAHFLRLDRFRDCPDDPLIHIYSELIDLSVQGLSVDIEDLLD